MQKPTFKNKKHLRKQAFTLIELLIVIAIIGMLFIVLVSKVDFATDKAKATGVQTDFRSFQMAFDTVAKENAGFNTFGWDTGDANQNGKRDSYDEGDNGAGGGTAKNGIQDGDEVFTGHKVYDETFTKVFSLKKNGTGSYDRDALNRLETAINANLDPKLHITIKDDGEIVMANGAQDPWNKEYHGWYITNAETDGKDRGAIVMYSDGANGEFGSEHSISNGIVSISIPGNNKYGKDDYALASIYTYVNGYGEVKNVTSGFTPNQTIIGNNGFNSNMGNNTGDNLGGGNDDSGEDTPIATYSAGLYKTGSNYTEMISTFDELLSTGILSWDGWRFDVNDSAALAGDLVLPEGLEYLGEYGCFDYEPYLTGIILPSTFKGAADDTFSECPLMTYNVYDGLNYLGTATNPYYMCMGIADTSKTDFVIHQDTKIISGAAFYDEDAVTSLSVPDGLISTGWINLDENLYTIYNGCYYLGNESNPYVILIDVADYSNLSDNTEIVVHPNTKVIGTYALCYTEIVSVTLPEGLNGLCEGALLEASITDIKLPSTLKHIGQMCFKCCPELTNLSIPANVTWIPNEIADYCPKLTTVQLPNTVKAIQAMAFAYCEALESIIIPNSVVWMDCNVFEDCTNLKTVTLSTNMTHLASQFFRDCVSLVSVQNIENIKTFGEDVFMNCTSFTGFYIGDDVIFEPTSFAGTNMSAYYVSPNHPLYSVTDGVLYSKDGTTIYSYPAAKAETSFTVPNGVTTIGHKAFSGCKNLQTINFGNTLTSIEDQAFENCTALTELVIPDNITNIGGSAFSGCSSLVTVDIGAGVEVINSFTFNACNSLRTINALNVKEIYGYGFGYIKPSNYLVINVTTKLTSVQRSAFYASRYIKLMYDGTLSQWNNVEKEWSWYSGLYSVTCTDGNAELKN